MRQTGYYFVEYEGKRIIAEFTSEIVFEGTPSQYTREWWRLFGLFHMPALQDDAFTYISPTPITPEKMAAIDEVVGYFKSRYRNGTYQIINEVLLDILNKHKLI